MIRFLSLLVSIPIIIIIAAFAYRNAQLVKVDLFVVEVNIPFAAIILICLILGGILGYLSNIFVLIMQKKKIKQLEKHRQYVKGLSDVFKSDT